MAIYIYNCKRCKTGKRIEYPIRRGAGRYFRIDGAGAQIPAGVWIDRIGGGMPAVYGGDPAGVCNCGKMMSYGRLSAVIAPNHKCDARCTHARGHSCECSCGGENHGSGWAGQQINEREPELVE